MFGISRNQAIRWASLISAFLAGGVMIAHGDTVSGIGVITASISGPVVAATGQ